MYLYTDNTVYWVVLQKCPKCQLSCRTEPVYLCRNSLSSKRLDCVAETSRSRRKDADDEAQLWSSMLSLADDKDLLDVLAHSAADASSARLVPPAQFRRPTPPSVSRLLRHRSLVYSSSSILTCLRSCVVRIDQINFQWKSIVKIRFMRSECLSLIHIWRCRRRG